MEGEDLCELIQVPWYYLVKWTHLVTHPNKAGQKDDCRVIRQISAFNISFNAFLPAKTLRPIVRLYF